MSRISIAPSWFSFSPLLSSTRLQGRCLFRSTKECFTEVHLLKCTPLRAMQSDPSFVLHFVLICGLPKELRLEREYLFTIEQFNFRLIRPTRRNDVEPFIVVTNVEAVLKKPQGAWKNRLVEILEIDIYSFIAVIQRSVFFYKEPNDRLSAVCSTKENGIRISESLNIYVGGWVGSNPSLLTPSTLYPGKNRHPTSGTELMPMN